MFITYRASREPVVSTGKSVIWTLRLHCKYKSMKCSHKIQAEGKTRVSLIAGMDWNGILKIFFSCYVVCNYIVISCYKFPISAHAH